MTTIKLSSGGELRLREEYRGGPLRWQLFRNDSYIRTLDQYESGFVESTRQHYQKYDPCIAEKVTEDAQITSNRIKELAIEAGLITSHASDREGLRDFDYRKFAEFVYNDALEKAAIKSWSCGMDWHMRKTTSDVREVGSAIAREIRDMKI